MAKIEKTIVWSFLHSTKKGTKNPVTNAVLVLNQYDSANKPMIVDFDGKIIHSF